MMFGRALIQWIRSCADLTEIPVDRRVGAGELPGYKGNRSLELKQSLLIELLYDLSALKLVQPVHRVSKEAVASSKIFCISAGISMEKFSVIGAAVFSCGADVSSVFCISGWVYAGC